MRDLGWTGLVSLGVSIFFALLAPVSSISGFLFWIQAFAILITGLVIAVRQSCKKPIILKKAVEFFLPVSSAASKDVAR